jgi:hypothetical protein
MVPVWIYSRDGMSDDRIDKTGLAWSSDGELPPLGEEVLERHK